MSKHSPFPWRVDPRLPTAVFDADGDKIAATKEGHAIKAIDPETAANNAALIAAIPEMVAALERMVLVFQPFTSRPVGAPNSIARLEQEEQKSAYHAARAVLKKVTKT